MLFFPSLDPEIKSLLDEIKSGHEINQGHEKNEAGCLEEQRNGSTWRRKGGIS